MPNLPLQSDPTAFISASHIHIMRDSANEFIDAMAKALSVYDSKPSPTSIASLELGSFLDPTQVETAHLMGIHFIEAAADHFMVFVDSIEEPAKTIAPFTCVRGLMESCALSAWLLDPEADAPTRVQRSFAFRLDGYDQQEKIVRKTNDAAGITKVNNSRQRLQQLAQQYNFPPIRKRGVIVGYGQRWPGITKLIDLVLDKEVAYRILSGVAHSHHWALTQTSFRIVDHPTEAGEKALEKYFHPVNFLYLGQLATECLALSSRYLWELYGWDQADLDRVFNDLHNAVFGSS